MPLPSWPLEFAPQHHTPPPATAQLWFWPAAMSETIVSIVLDPVWTWTGDDRWLLVVSPSWPLVLRPQHHAVPSLLRVHVCWSPPATSTAPVNDGTSVGTARVLFLEPSPT